LQSSAMMKCIYIRPRQSKAADPVKKMKNKRKERETHS